MISKTSKYAIRALIYLAVKEEENRMLGIKEISKDLDIPTPFLGKILQNLVKFDLLKSTKGPNGGFSLKKPASEISIYDLVIIIDGPALFNECLIGLHSCMVDDHGSHCPTYDKMSPIRKQLENYFKTETIEHLKKEVIDSDGKIIV